MIVVKGVQEAIDALVKKTAEIDAATKTATATVLHMMERAAKAKLAESSHPPGTRRPLVLALDAPPSLVTGTLRRSITVTGPESIGAGAYQGKVGPTAIYGRVQELGGGPRNLPARPYMQPAYDSLRAQIPEIYRAAWLAAVMK